jgi:hypothetical protein
MHCRCACLTVRHLPPPQQGSAATNITLAAGSYSSGTQLLLDLPAPLPLLPGVPLTFSFSATPDTLFPGYGSLTIQGFYFNPPPSPPPPS